MYIPEYQCVIKRKTEDRDKKSLSSVSVPGAGTEQSELPASQ
jgi:hypothetical protein